MSKSHSNSNPEDAVSALSIAPYFPFPRVIPVAQHLTTGPDGVVHSQITFEPDPRRRPVCSGCGRKTRAVHSTSVRRVLDLSLAGARTELLVPRRKLRCRRCGVRSEQHEFLAPYRRITTRLERAVADLCRVLPVKHVAAHFGLAWHTVKEIDKRRLVREVGTPSYEGLRFLAVDEVAVHKGHTYMTTVLDLETGRMVWIGRDRTKATLLSFFEELSAEERSTIEAVATDMASGYREAIKEACPQAALVYDMFHAVAKFSREVIDRVRVDESKKQDRAGNEAGRQLIKGSRYLLLKNEKNLSGKQRERLDLLLEANENLNLVYVLKDQLKRIWTYAGPGWARRALEDWCAMAEASGLSPLKTFARNLRRHAEGIINHCRYPIHTGRLEGVNNKIKVIKRMAYGFRDDDYFILKIKGAFPGEMHPIPR
jgi:transposase